MSLNVHRTDFNHKPTFAIYSALCTRASETALDLFTFKIDYLETNMQKHNESKQRALKVITMIR